MVATGVGPLAFSLVRDFFGDYRPILLGNARRGWCGIYTIMLLLRFLFILGVSLGDSR